MVDLIISIQITLKQNVDTKSENVKAIFNRNFTKNMHKPCARCPDFVALRALVPV